MTNNTFLLKKYVYSAALYFRVMINGKWAAGPSQLPPT